MSIFETVHDLANLDIDREQTGHENPSVEWNMIRKEFHIIFSDGERLIAVQIDLFRSFQVKLRNDYVIMTQ